MVQSCSLPFGSRTATIEQSSDELLWTSGGHLPKPMTLVWAVLLGAGETLTGGSGLATRGPEGSRFIQIQPQTVPRLEVLPVGDIDYEARAEATASTHVGPVGLEHRPFPRLREGPSPEQAGKTLGASTP